MNKVLHFPFVPKKNRDERFEVGQPVIVTIKSEGTQEWAVFVTEVDSDGRASALQGGGPIYRSSDDVTLLFGI